MKSVLLIGLLPTLVDFSSLPGMTEEKLAAGLKQQAEKLRWVALVPLGCTSFSVAI